MNDNRSALQPQWDIGKSVFDSFSSLKGLVAAAGVDDVQPQAVLAAEALGSSLHIDAKRYDEAINALGGNQSVRLSSIKATIGLTSGGLRHYMRQSSALVRFFALCASLKLCYVDDEIGVIVFNMLAESQLLKKIPASSSQLRSLVGQVSGHAEQIAPDEVMDQVARKFELYGLTRGLYARFGLEELSRLLVRIFEALCEESTKAISIYGYHHSVWFSSALLWLLGDNITIFINSDKVLGSDTGKVAVHVSPEQLGIGWSVKIWRQSKDPQTFICAQDIESTITSVRRLPLRATRHYIEEEMLALGECALQRHRASVVIGRLALALILVMVEKSYVRCDARSSTASRTKFTNILSSAWLNNLPAILTQYGWDDEGLQLEASRLAADLGDIVELEIGSIQYILSTHISRDVEEESDDLMSVMQAQQRIRKSILRRCREFIVSQEVGYDEGILANTASDYEASNIIDPAFFLAHDMFFTSTCSLQGHRRYISTMDYIHLDSDSNLVDLLEHMFCEGLLISEFHHRALTQVLPGLRHVSSGDLIVTANGMVAGLSILWKPTTAQETALAITVMRGHVRKSDIPYERIQETSPKYKMPASKLVPLSIRRTKNRSATLGLSSTPPRCQFETIVAESNNTLELRRYMIREDERLRDTKVMHDVSWIQAVYAIATAHHISPGYLPTSLRETIGEKLRSKISEKPVHTAAAPCFLPMMGGASRILVTTNEQESLRIFAAAEARSRDSTSGLKLFIRHGGDPMQCLDAAGQWDGGWMLIC